LGLGILRLRFLRLNFCARCGEVLASRGDEFGPGLAIQLYGQAKQAATAFGDAPATRTRHFRHQLSRVQTLQQAAHRSTAANRVFSIDSVDAEQLAANSRTSSARAGLKPAMLRPATTLGSVS
jgi:hypothetical protein